MLSVGFVTGVWAAQFIQLFGLSWLVFPAILVIGLARRWLFLPAYVVAAVVGVSYGSLEKSRVAEVNGFVGRTVQITGTIREDVGTISGKKKSLQLSNWQVNTRAGPGNVWLSVSGQDIKRGDRVTVAGVAGHGFGSFALVLQNARLISIERPFPGDVGRIVRDWFAAVVRRGIAEPAASLGIGFLTGQKSTMPADIAESLRIAGLSHIIVASGYNLTILVRLARRLFVNKSKHLSMTTAFIMIFSFVMITGLSPSMTRAGIVSSLSLLTWAYGRTIHPFVLLSLVAAITVLIQPSYVWGDLGWQLSFAAFFGVMVVGPLLQKFFFDDESPGAIRQILGETIAAHIVTVPIVALSFGTMSQVAIFANLSIVPFVPLAMLLTFLSGVVSLILPPLANLAGLPAQWLLQSMIEVATKLAALPWSQTNWAPTVVALLIYYSLLAVACYVMWRTTQHRLVDYQII